MTREVRDGHTPRDRFNHGFAYGSACPRQSYRPAKSRNIRPRTIAPQHRPRAPDRRRPHTDSPARTRRIRARAHWLRAAAANTGVKRSRLSAIEQLMFFCENVSEAAAKTATSVAPAATAASKPRRLGTSTGYVTPSRRGSRAHQFSVVAHLRHPLRRHKCRGLNGPQPRIRKHSNELDLRLRGDALRLVLQPIARAHLDNANAAQPLPFSAAPSRSKCNSSTPSLTWSPAAK